jgi:hypothetical protein
MKWSGKIPHRLGPGEKLGDSGYIPAMVGIFEHV